MNVPPPIIAWAGIKNGDLLRRAEGEFDLFITSDQNIRYQQNLAGRRIPILELSTNKLRRLQAAAPLIQAALATVQPGDFRPLAASIVRADPFPRLQCGT